ncbi:Integrator complex subunit 4 [Schistosoma japonicum]|uniref:Integrator complex subunit 4 n=1 Tax=Schistosoma japonicum TaxID=6182 RepID=A0A4Z2CRX5_SCHJA|nr:Integrator complex subunit 4 [Schistosoma japonicum]
MLFSEYERFLTKLRSLPPIATQELSVLGVINEAFTCSSAHIRSGCLDLLAAWNSPHTCLSAGSAGEVVLWHTRDNDPRVRDRAFHCLLTWLCSLNTSFKPNGKTKYFGNFKESTKKELTLWFETNLESVYSAACHGLLDNEELVRRTSLHVLGKLSTIWPHHSLVEVPVSSLNSSVVSSKPCFDADLEEIRLVDDAFIRVCCRIQDPSRSVRQLAAYVMADLAKFVTENCLLQTLEKTVMSDKQIRRSMIEQDNKSRRGNNMRSTLDNRAQTKSLTSESINLISSGSNGAIISGLEDDYFEIRCTTLATVTHIASINTRFALSCQDLLVDMLTDDIQDVRLAAVRALSAVGDKVPVKSEQVSIITSALAEGSGRIRRRLHYLLSHCRLASAPCLISLLDGLLQNLRRYPEDRDNLWRCAASVGRNHPVFVETCLSSLLRTHSWLNGPEPVKEDPAYLTVLLLVLNAEPSVPGMLAKFPRHVTSTKIYLQELLPSLLPKTEFQNVSALDLLNKKFELDVDSSLKSSSINMVEHCSLHRFTASTICRIRQLFTTIHDELSCYCRLSVKQNNVIEDKVNNIHSRIPCYKYQSRRNALLSRLIFNDLLDCVKKLDHIGKLKNLLYWLMLISTTGWYLVSVGFIHFRSITSSSSSTTSRSSCDTVNYGVNFCLDDNCKEKTTNLVDERIIKLLSKAIRNSLKINYLFSGKTKLESHYVFNLYTNIFNLLNSLISNQQLNINLLIDALYCIVKLLSNSLNENKQIDYSIQLPINRKRSFPMEHNTEQLMNQ